MPGPAHLLADQPLAEASGIDEQVAGNGPPFLEPQRDDGAGLRMLLDSGNGALDLRNAARLLSQVAADQRLVEMIGIVERADRHDRAVGLQGIGALPPLHEVGEEMHLRDRPAGGDRIDVEIFGRGARGRRQDLVRIVDGAVISDADAPPVAMANAELDGRLGLAQELHLIEAEALEQGAENRGRSLAHADGRNLARTRPPRW